MRTRPIPKIPACRFTRPSRGLLLALLPMSLLVGLAGGLTGCGAADSDAFEDSPADVAQEGAPDGGRRDAVAEPAAKTDAKATDGAGFQLEYLEAEDPELAELARAIHEADVIEPEIAWLNQQFALPRRLPVRWLECGEDNAFYDADNGVIELCYEMVAASAEQFESDGDDAEDAFWYALNTAVFFFHHEVGHALIDLYDLPITGREEDAVDELAALTLIDGWEDGAYAVLSAADSFFISGMEEEAESDPEDLPFWDEHAFDLQRFYSIACLVYGSDPEEMADLIDDGSVPEERAEICVEEFAQKRESWRRILEPHDLSP